MLRGVVAARRRRYLMMNAPTERVEELESILPAMGAPSVIALADPAQVALHAAVDADDDLGSAAAPQGRRRERDPRPARSSGSSRERRATTPSSCRASPRSWPTCAIAATRRCATGPSGSTERSRSRCASRRGDRRCRARRRDTRGGARARADGARVPRAPASRGLHAQPVPRRRDRAALAPARVGRRLRPRRQDAAPELARHDGRPGAGRRGRRGSPSRRRSRCRRSSRRLASSASRDLRARRRPGDRGARVRHGDGGASTRSSVRDSPGRPRRSSSSRPSSGSTCPPARRRC